MNGEEREGRIGEVLECRRELENRGVDTLVAELRRAFRLLPKRLYMSEIDQH